MKRVLLLSTVVATALFAVAQTATPSVEETLGLLENGLTEAPLDAALTNIGNWQVTLEGSDDPALQELGGLLGDLSTELQAETINPAEVGALLTSIGEGTSAAAESAGDDGLANLGSLLSEAGSSLASGDSGMTGGMMGGMTGGMMSGGGM